MQLEGTYPLKSLSEYSSWMIKALLSDLDIISIALVALSLRILLKSFVDHWVLI